MLKWIMLVGGGTVAGAAYVVLAPSFKGDGSQSFASKVRQTLGIADLYEGGRVPPPETVEVASMAMPAELTPLDIPMGEDVWVNGFAEETVF